jgi:carbon starvation protein
MAMERIVCEVVTFNRASVVLACVKERFWEGRRDKMGSRLGRYGVWVLVAIVGAVCWGMLALARGETVNAGWLLFAAIASYAIAYRFYARFIQTRVLETDDSRATPGERLNNGRDFEPMDKRVLFGHHFAAIAGAGPLVGPVLAAQMGFLPGTIWIIVGVILAGAVQDMTILFFSMRRDGKSLGQMAREEIGPVGGAAALIAVLSIMVILLAVLALVVVLALAASPWGSFSLAMTIPIALLMGVYLRFLRPGRVLEVTVIGVALLILAILGGGWISESSAYAAAWTFTPNQLVLALVVYGFVASVLPVWLLLAPRDYLSTFMKIGTILLLAVGIAITLPPMHMPRFTEFAFNGQGPVFAGSLFPFVFIIIACGALSGFHSLVASGTTPKLIQKESQVRIIGYGAMLMESFVAVMAMIAATTLDPGVYFAMNANPVLLGDTVQSAAQAVQGFGFSVSPETLQQTANAVGEDTIIGRTGGAPTLAVGISQILPR